MPLHYYAHIHDVCPVWVSTQGFLFEFLLPLVSPFCAGLRDIWYYIGALGMFV